MVRNGIPWFIVTVRVRVIYIVRTFSSKFSCVQHKYAQHMATQMKTRTTAIRDTLIPALGLGLGKSCFEQDGADRQERGSRKDIG